MNAAFRIMGFRARKGSEPIDEAETEKEALRKVEEYSISFGKEWSIYAEPIKPRL